MRIEESKNGSPILGLDAVKSAAQPERNFAGGIEGANIGLVQPTRPEQRVNRAGALRCAIAPERIGPAVAPGAAQEQRPRRDQRQQLVLVDGKRLFGVGIAAISRGEPMWIGACDLADAFAHAAACKRRPAGARLVGDNARDAVLLLIVDKLPELVRLQTEAIKNIKIDKVTVWDSMTTGSVRTIRPASLA